MIADIVGNRTLKSQWDETVHYYGSNLFLKYISVTDQITDFTYREFDRRVKQTANVLLDLGIRKGELVALHLHNRPEFLMCWLAIAQIGAVSVPLNEHYQFDECKYVLDKCGITHLITEPCSLPMYLEHLCELSLTHLFLTGGISPEGGEMDSERDVNSSGNGIISTRGGVVLLDASAGAQSDTLKRDVTLSSDDMAMILFTSGTTQHPKGVIYTHCNVIYGGVFHADQIGIRTGERFLTSMPCYHMDFLEMEAAPVICTGSTLVMLEHFSARRFWRQICEQKANYTDLMSLMNRTLLLQPVHPWEKEHCLKQVYFSMGLSDEEKEAFEERFSVRLLNSYGMTETITAVTCVPLFGEQRWPSVGRPALSYQIKIVNEAGDTLPPGQEGEICVHGVPGRTLTKGYYLDEEATARLLDRDGWLHSGDWGHLDEEGWLYFSGRCGQMIKRSGENISCSEVECVLTSHPMIVDAAVIGVPDPLRNQAVKAYIQLKEEGTKAAPDMKEEITQYCEARLAHFKVPTQIEFVDHFPRTATGKIKKAQLTSHAADDADPSAPGGSACR